MEAGWIAALVAVAGFILAVIGWVGVRKLKRDLDESTIQALQRNNEAIAAERDELAHRVEILERSDADKAKIIEVLRDTVTARAEISALGALVTSQHDESLQVLKTLAGALDPNVRGSFAAQTVRGLKDVHGIIGAAREDDDGKGANRHGT